VTIAVDVVAKVDITVMEVCVCVEWYGCVCVNAWDA
jgi:hypothetical protein